jgi:hypothetical protein
VSAKEQAFADVEAAYVEFRDLLVPLPDEAYAEDVEGEWNVAQVLAHMAGWFRELAPVFAMLERGETPPAASAYDESWNARFAAGALDGSAALDDFDDAFHVFYGAARLVDERFFEPAGGSPSAATSLLAGMGTEHFAEHRAAIEAWLAHR